MNYSTYRFTLDIHKTKSQVSIPVLFQDTGTQFYINLTDGGKPYHISDGCKATLYGKKPKLNPNGKYDTLLEECEVIDGGTRIRYEFSDQTTTQLGSVACEIRLYSADGKLLTTPAFEILVEARVIEDDEIIESQDERTALDRIFESEAAREEAEKARDDAEKAREEAEKQRGENAFLLNSEKRQTVNSDVVITGNFDVLGTFTKTNVDSLIVKDRFIVCNNGKSKLTSGIVIRTGEIISKIEADYYNAYGIIFDPDTDTVRLGRGFIEEAREWKDDTFGEYEYKPSFTFGYVELDKYGNPVTHEEEGQAISTRSDSGDITNRHLVAWDAENKKFVDAGDSYSSIDISLINMSQNIDNIESRMPKNIPNGNLVKWDADNNKMVDAGTDLRHFMPDMVAQKDKFMVCNRNGVREMSGILIPIDAPYNGADDTRQSAYAITFDPNTETLRIGQGTIYHGGDYDRYYDAFWFLYDGGSPQTVGPLQDQAIATRADDFTEGHIPQWDAQRNMFVDSGVSLGDISTALDELHAYAQFLIGGAE